MPLSKNVHLTKEQTIKQGSFFTPAHIVKIVFDMAKDFIAEDDVVVDFGAGYGAFVEQFSALKNKIVATDIDGEALAELSKQFPAAKTVLENSLLGVDKKKYCRKGERIVAVGNPPYNDVTSAYQKGKKGGLACDEAVKARDFGISFLKMYDAVEARLVCVLHPLAYLIKKANFNCLGNFRRHYRLKNAVVFSSAEFENIKKGNAEFPVVAALYFRDSDGMDFDFVRRFEFDVLNSRKKFCLSDFETIDGKIQKYPDKDSRSYQGLQFYTLRDINALKRNATFLDGGCANGIKVTAENLYQYAWLEYFKETFSPKENAWLYGNLSPFYDAAIETPDRRRFLVRYVWDKKPLVQKYFSREVLEARYGKF